MIYCDDWSALITCISGCLDRTGEVGGPPLILIIRACCLSVWCRSDGFLQYINSMTLLNGRDGIGSFTMCCDAVMRLLVVSPNLLSASIKIIYDL